MTEPQVDNGWTKLCREEEGREEMEVSVGDLATLCQLPSPPDQLWPMKHPVDDPHVFLCHCGQDGVKETLARPTRWFLDRVLHVQAFLDDGDSVTGERVSRTLAKQAYQSTRALILLSPMFRKRKYCVMELNTFMSRWRQQQTNHHQQNMNNNNKGLRLLPVLWGIENMDGYHPVWKDIIWIGHRNMDCPAEFLVRVLWPEILRNFGREALSRTCLESFLAAYVQETMNRQVLAVPPPLKEFAQVFHRKRWQSRFRLVACVLSVGFGVLSWTTATVWHSSLDPSGRGADWPFDQISNLETGQQHSASTCEVLWVDDNLENVSYESSTLKDLGCNIRFELSTNDAKQSLQDPARKRPHLIISDMGRTEGGSARLKTYNPKAGLHLYEFVQSLDRSIRFCIFSVETNPYIDVTAFAELGLTGSRGTFCSHNLLEFWPESILHL